MIHESLSSYLKEAYCIQTVASVKQFEINTLINTIKMMSSYKSNHLSSLRMLLNNLSLRKQLLDDSIYVITAMIEPDENMVSSLITSIGNVNECLYEIESFFKNVYNKTTSHI
jgi:hypothetical protein